MRPLLTRYLLCGAALVACSQVSMAGPNDDAPTPTHRVVTLDQIGGAAKETLINAIGSSTVGTINEVSYRGRPVMYEVDQQMARRRVEILIRYDGAQVPMRQIRKIKEFAIKKLEPAKLPEKVSSAAARQFAPDAIAEVREVSYRGSIIIYEVDNAEQCFGYLVDGQQAFTIPRPATQPADEQEAEGQGGDGGDGNA